jgi:hypothetical protein
MPDPKAGSRCRASSCSDAGSFPSATASAVRCHTSVTATIRASGRLPAAEPKCRQFTLVSALPGRAKWVPSVALTLMPCHRPPDHPPSSAQVTGPDIPRGPAAAHVLPGLTRPGCAGGGEPITAASANAGTPGPR